VTPDSSAEQGLEGFAEAMLGFGNPLGGGGEPEAQRAVETSAANEPPSPAAVKPDAKAPAAPAASETVKPDATKTPNFDGLSADQKKTWERLHKAGFVSAEEVERARLESLYQQSWTTNNMEAAEKVKAAEARVSEMEKWKAGNEERLKRLETILSDKKREDAFYRASDPEFTEESADPDAPVSRKDVQRLLDDERAKNAARQKEAEDRTAAEDREYAGRKVALSKTMLECQRLLGVDKATMTGYLDAIAAKLPVDKDPVLYFAPHELREKVELMHEVAQTKAEVERLKQQLAGKSSAAESRSKQSLAPSRRVSEPAAPKDAWTETLAELNVEPDMSNVQGLGGWGRNGT
jgi:hypothetical protein